jgi:hypothetical protein
MKKRKWSTVTSFYRDIKKSDVNKIIDFFCSDTIGYLKRNFKVRSVTNNKYDHHFVDTNKSMDETEMCFVQGKLDGIGSYYRHVKYAIEIAKKSCDVK